MVDARARGENHWKVCTCVCAHEAIIQLRRVGGCLSAYMQSSSLFAGGRRINFWTFVCPRASSDLYIRAWVCHKDARIVLEIGVLCKCYALYILVKLTAESNFKFNCRMRVSVIYALCFRNNCIHGCRSVRRILLHIWGWIDKFENIYIYIQCM